MIVVVWRALWLYMPHINHRVRKLWSQVPTGSRKKNGSSLEVLLLLLLLYVFSVGKLTCKTSKPGDRWTLSYSSCGNLGSNITERLVEMAATNCCIEACHLLSIQWKFVWWAIHNSKFTSNISFGTMLSTRINTVFCKISHKVEGQFIRHQHPVAGS